MAFSAVVSYRNSTSNHNNSAVSTSGVTVVSYRNSTSNHNSSVFFPRVITVVSYRNSTSNHNYDAFEANYKRVVSYRNSTSNHNCVCFDFCISLLYLIEILHQTTTSLRRFRLYGGCILSKFYIKPQQLLLKKETLLSCILSKFYIKPQLRGRYVRRYFVVSYRNSTSNHNIRRLRPRIGRVVSYRNSTSNHNVGPHID